MKFYQSLEDELKYLAENSQLRTISTVKQQGKFALYQGKKLLNLSGNDYLGLAANNSDSGSLMAEFLDKENFMMSSSSRLLTGSSSAHADLEKLLESLYLRPALVFNSGYHANVGILPALTKRKDLILSDKLNHASIIDGARLAAADFKRYPHLDIKKLEILLENNYKKYDTIFIITESIFSMDGDVVDIEALVELKKRYRAVLIVDEAHSVGVLGNRGLGLCEAKGLINDIDIIIGTFGKALASVGAYAITSKLIKDYLINRMRSFIFTTALPPVCLRWSIQMLKKSVEMNKQRQHLQAISAQLQQAFSPNESLNRNTSHIIPAIIGSDEDAQKSAANMQQAGFLVFPIRPPTVPEGTSRLRFSLNAAMDWQDIKIIPSLI